MIGSDADNGVDGRCCHELMRLKVLKLFPDICCIFTGVITYSILSGNSEGRFQLDTNTGRLSTSKTLDRETSSSYTLVILGIDQGSSPQSGN